MIANLWPTKDAPPTAGRVNRKERHALLNLFYPKERQAHRPRPMFNLVISLMLHPVTSD